MYRGVTEKTNPVLKAKEQCAGCGKKPIGTSVNNSWHRIAAYHCDEDIDIRETLKYYDVCSFECYLKQMRKSVDELESSKTARIDGMDLPFVRKLLFFYGA